VENSYTQKEETMVDQMHKAVLEDIAEKINDERNTPPKGFEDRPFTALESPREVCENLSLSGVFPGLRFTDAAHFSIQVVEGEVQAGLHTTVISQDKPWVVDKRIPASNHPKVALLEQSIEKFCEFYSEYGECEGEIQEITATTLTLCYQVTLCQQFGGSFLLCDPDMYKKLRAYLVKLGMTNLPLFE